MAFYVYTHQLLRIRYWFLPMAIALIACLIGSITAITVRAEPTEVPLYRVYERAVTNNTTYANKFTDVTLHVTYRHLDSGIEIPFWGFYAGNGDGGNDGDVWKMRFMPNQTGTWKYEYTWSDGTAGGSGSFVAVTEGAGKGVLQPYTENPLWFAYNGTDPAFLKSYYVITGGFLNEPISWAAPNVYQKIADRGYNHVMLNMLSTAYTSQHFEDSPGSSSDFLYRETSPSTTINLTLFESLEDHLGWLNDRDIGVHMFQGFDGKEEYGSGSPRYNDMSDSERDFLVRYVAARLAPYANVAGWNYTWETSGSGPELDLMDRLIQYDPWNHLRTFHGPATSQNDVNGNFTDDRYTFITTEPSWQGDRDGKVFPVSLTHEVMLGHNKFGKPAINTEGWGLWRPCYNADNTSVRRHAWAVTMAAGSYTWSDLPSCENGNSSNDIFSLEDAAQAVDVQYKIMTEDVDFYRMLPANELIADRSAETFALAEPGNQYMVYDQEGGSFTLAVASGTYNGKWVNTLTGEEVAIGEVHGNDSGQSFTTPDTSVDWLLVLKKGTGDEPTATPNLIKPTPTPTPDLVAPTATPTLVPVVPTATPAPGGETITVDDTDATISYSGDWGTVTHAWGRYNETTHESQVAGSSASFTFTGTCVELIGELQPWGGEATLMMDDTTQETVSFEGSVDTHQHIIFPHVV